MPILPLLPSRPNLLRHAPARSLLLLALTLTACALATTAPSAFAANPTATTLAASSVTYASATLNGIVNPRGGDTNYVFQYGTTRGYGAQTPLSPAGAGTGNVKVSQTIAGLSPVTIYHYRILATGPAGTTATGGDRTFATGPVPLSLAIAGVPNPVLYGNSLLVEGTLTGTGAASHPVQLQANPFPYTAGFAAVGNPQLTSASGGFSFPYLGLTANTQLRVVTVGKPEVSSPIVLENVAVRVTFHVRATSRPGYARLYGTVTPAEVGALVGFQLLRVGNKSLNKGGTVVKAATPNYSTFSRVLPVKRGLYKALIQVNDDGAHVSGYSAPVLIR
jgi:hypothetical protein